jgi:hypothetical protein
VRSLRTVDAGSDALLDECGDFTGLGVATKRSLGEDKHAIEGHLEAALRGRQQLDTGDDRRPSRKQVVRQTDGARNVVSGDAEFDLEVVTRIQHGFDPMPRGASAGYITTVAPECPRPCRA